MVLPRVGVGGLLHGAYNYTGCYPKQVVFRRRSIRRTGSEPIVVNDRLPRGQQVITSHLLFRIIPQHVAVLQPRIGPLCRERQISYQSEVKLLCFLYFHTQSQFNQYTPLLYSRNDPTFSIFVVQIDHLLHLNKTITLPFGHAEVCVTRTWREAPYASFPIIIRPNISALHLNRKQSPTFNNLGIIQPSTNTCT